MRHHLSLGTIGGVAVDLSPSLLGIVVLLSWSLASTLLPNDAPGYSTAAYWLVGTASALVFLASILIHELSHATVAHRHGIAVEGITLWLFGGVARLRGQAATPRIEGAIALAGPAASAIAGSMLVATAWALDRLGAGQLVPAGLGWIGRVNLTLAVFNLLPGAPLDGGRVLAAVLWWRRGDATKARVAAARAGHSLGGLLVAAGLAVSLLGADLVSSLWLVFLGLFLRSAADQEGRAVRLMAASSRLRVADVMTPRPLTVPARLTVADLVDDVLPTARFTTFPLIDSRGGVNGLVTLGRVRQVPRGRWETTPLASIAVPRSELTFASPDEHLDVVLGRLGEDGRILVEVGGDLVGVISPSDLVRLISRLELAGRP